MAYLWGVMMSEQFFEEFFGTCSFCKKEKLIVLDVSWNGQKASNGYYVKGGRIWLCSYCCKNYRLEINNYDYDLKVNEMCEVLNETKSY